VHILWCSVFAEYELARQLGDLLQS